MKENYVNVLENMLDEPAKDEGAEGLKILMAKAYQSAEKVREKKKRVCTAAAHY